MKQKIRKYVNCVKYTFTELNLKGKYVDTEEIRMVVPITKRSPYYHCGHCGKSHRLAVDIILKLFEDNGYRRWGITDPNRLFIQLCLDCFNAFKPKELHLLSLKYEGVL